jgi:hypothetical protein
MRSDQQRRLDSLSRVGNFKTSHADVLGGLTDSPASKQLDAALATTIAHVNSQASADRMLAGQMASQKAISKELITKHMQPITKFARAKLRGLPEVTALTNPGRSGSPNPLLRAARSMATTAATYQSQLVEAGFPADTVVQLTTAADSLGAVMAQREQAKNVRVTSTTGIHETLIAGRDAVKLLGAAIHRQFSSDATFLAGWRTASRVTANPVRAKTVAPAATATAGVTATATATKPASTAVIPVAVTSTAATPTATTPAAVTPVAVTSVAVTPTIPAVSTAPSSAAAPVAPAVPVPHV